MIDNAYVTIITNEYYYHGAVALGISLCKTDTKYRKVVLVSDGVNQELRNNLRTIWDEIIQIDVLDSKDIRHLSLIGRPELGVTFSKLLVWELIQFKTCVFLDADTIVLRNIDELFCRDELSAAPDIGWPDCFNSGVFVFKPCLETYRNLLKLAGDVGSFDGGDQGLFNTYWVNWVNEQDKRLPFIFNVAINMSYFYNAAILKFKRDIRVLHFLGLDKPWLRPCYVSSENVGKNLDTSRDEFYAKWWDFYNEKDTYFNRNEVHKSKTEHEIPQIKISLDHTHTILPDVTIEHTAELEDDVIINIPNDHVGNHEEVEPVHKIPEAEMEELNLEAPIIEQEDIEEVIDEKQWRFDWQRGHIDYHGRDASYTIIQNILLKLK
ncbi:Glycogenin-2 [Oopsacas minuta]|uniref:glycogenin glucosyltransferase n=1 Tax=Oopsacas minuta TaxID=111878 RepID=A0AAV7JNT4_9METZ|nr:Glycogenin-2 [Oopsacas minuta]